MSTPICGCWSSPSRTTRSSCSTTTGHVLTWNGGARRLKGYEARRDHRPPLLGLLSARAGGRGRPERILEAARARTGATRPRAGASARTAAQFWADVVITALRDEHGTLVGFGKVTRDLTSRQLAIEQLRSAAAELRVANAELEQFRLLITSVRDYAIFVLDVVRAHPDVEHRAPRTSRATPPTRSIGRHFELFYTEEARARRHPAYELEVATREGRFEEEGWRVRKDGTLFWANVVITALRDAQRRARRVRQGHARPDRAPRGAAAARAVRAPRARGSRAAAAAQRGAGAGQPRDRRPARPARDPRRPRPTPRPDLTGAAFGVYEPGFAGTGVIRSDDISEPPWPRTRPGTSPCRRGTRRSAATSRSRSRLPTARSRAACSSGTRTPGCSTRRPRRRR